MEKVERIKELVDICNYHSNLYYIKDNPEISDKEYDKLYQELETLESQTGCILSSSPTQKVQGKVLDSLIKVQHSELMLSAEKSKEFSDVLKFLGKHIGVISWKLDGLTLVLRYNEGKLQQAITRGGGDFGEDVTHNIKVFSGLPLNIPYQGYLEIRGEGLVTFKDFERINEELILKGEETYKSPRNLAAGSVRQLDSNITKKRNLIFKAFGIVKCDKVIKWKTEQLQFLQELGFDVVEHEVVDWLSAETLMEKFKEKLPSLSYLNDGLIFEYNDIEYGKSLGATGHHCRNLWAMKWNDDSYETIFRGVELNTTRTGMVSLTGLFDETDIDGVNVSRASLHNYDIFESLKLGIGDTITVYRANAVIPQIEENLTRSNTYKIEMKCPSCGSNIKIIQPKEARFLFCDNLQCPAQLVRKIEHAVSKDGLNIIGLSGATLEKFIDEGFIKNISDVYKLDIYKSKIVKMDGMGLRSYEKLQSAIEKSKLIDMSSFLVCLGIDQIGLGGAKRLAKHFKNDINKFLEATKSYTNFIGIEDFGTITAKAVYDYFKNEDNINQVLELLKYITIKTEEKKAVVSSDSPFTGKKIYGTGSFANYKKDELKALLESLGAEFANGYVKSLDYLIVGSLKGSSKEDKAKKDGVAVLTEDEFIEMIGR